MQKDTFRIGQWIHARVYERRCDLSPNGEYFLYFAFDAKRWQSETRGSWTAISRAPYLKALTLYAKGDTWNGGGLFSDDKSYLLNERYASHDLLFDHLKLACVRGTPPAVYGGNNESSGIYYPRLLRDGWRMDLLLSAQHIQVFEKTLRDDIALRKYCHYGKGPRPGGYYTDSHALVVSGDEVAVFPRWEWGDVIGERLAWAEDGKIYAATPGHRFDPKHPRGRARVLHDFNGMGYEPIEAPY